MYWTRLQCTDHATVIPGSLVNKELYLKISQQNCSAPLRCKPHSFSFHDKLLTACQLLKQPKLPRNKSEEDVRMERRNMHLQDPNFETSITICSKENQNSTVTGKEYLLFKIRNSIFLRREVRKNRSWMFINQGFQIFQLKWLTRYLRRGCELELKQNLNL